MPSFHVTSHDGREFDIEAPEGATEAQALAFVQREQQRILKQGPAVRGPDRQLPAPPPSVMTPQAAEPPETASDRVLGTAGSFLEGALGSWGDEAYGLGRMGRNATRALMGTEEFDPGKAMDEGQAEYDARLQRFGENHPIASTAISGAGMATGFAAPAFKTLEGASLAARMGSGLKTGAAYGALMGAGTGDGFSERFGHSMEGAGGGAVLGSVATPAIDAGVGLGKLAFRNVAPFLSEKLGRRVAQAGAERSIGSTLDHDGFTPSTALAEMSRRDAMGVPAFLSDLGDATRSRAASAQSGTGPGQAAVRKALESRQAAMAPRMQTHLETTLGPIADPHAQSAALTMQARTDSKPLYAAAYETPVTVTPKLREFMDSPVGPAALEAGADQIRLTPRSGRNVGSEEPYTQGIQWDPSLNDGQGTYRSGDNPVLETWDGAKRHIDDLEFDGSNRFLPSAGTPGRNAHALDLRRRELLEELDAQVPEYAAARAAYAGPAQDKAAFEAGLMERPGATRTRPDDARAQMKGMTLSQRDQYRLGDRVRLSRELQGVADNADASGPLRPTDAFRGLLEEVHGADAANRLLDRTGAERETYRTFAAVNRQSGKSPTGAESTVDAAGNAIAHAATGNIFGVIREGLKGAFTGRYGRYAQALKQELGDVLFDPNIKTVEQAMRRVEHRVRTDAAFRERLTAFTAQVGKLGTIQGVGNSGDETSMYGPTE